jgi:hypothetical protein
VGWRCKKLEVWYTKLRFFFFNSFFGGERGDCKIDGSSEGLSEIFPKKEKSVFDFYEKRLAVNNWLSIIV